MSVDRAFAVKERWVLVRSIPAQVCDVCGETTYAEADATRIQRILAGQETPVAFCRVPLFDFTEPASSGTAPKARGRQRLHKAPTAKSTDAA
jgi:hypothetical protein